MARGGQQSLARETARRIFGTKRLAVGAIVAVALSLTACSTSSSPSAGPAGGAPAPRPVAQVSISPSPGSGINPTTPVVVQAVHGKLTTVTVTNASKGNTVAGALSPDGAKWTSTEDLAYGASYRVVADATGTDGKTVTQQSTLTTVSPAAQAFPALTPAPPAPGLTFGVGQIIGVSFDHKVTDRAAAENALTVTTTPSQPGSWHWIDDRTLHYRPPSYWQPGTTVKLDAKLYGVNLGSGVYGKTDRSATYHIHDSWIAKADGATDQMQIVHNGAVVGTMPISMGKDATPTHSGPHVISDKQQQVVMDSCTYGVCPPSPKAYKSTEFWAERISNDGEFVHENPASVGAQGSTNVSHGCINLNPQNAQIFFNEFGLGDVVEAVNTPGGPLPIYDTYGDWELNWTQWQAGSALHH
ncbi:L,D-transpeptidase [Amycolatopsis echigonensis]|uniref:L,D-transpeptidase n=1 Tax=Amycolatopsis echigonensis TaxID=2576905 RepID=A0A8E1VZR6_9PSEU|nr:MULTISPECIES: Ig-like domain-containing protein [Amycolatopsis]MBB2501201.1 L,D-transpeptidase [Amycolatopsis echigonensis]